MIEFRIGDLVTFNSLYKDYYRASTSEEILNGTYQVLNVTQAGKDGMRNHPQCLLVPVPGLKNCLFSGVWFNKVIHNKRG